MKSTQVESAWAGATGVAIVIIIFAALAVTAAGAWHWFAAWLEFANAAPWVQALGSILAIAGTGFFVWFQVDAAKKQGDRAIRVERRWHWLEAISALADVARFALLLVGDVVDAHREDLSRNELRRLFRPSTSQVGPATREGRQWGSPERRGGLDSHSGRAR